MKKQKYKSSLQCPVCGVIGHTSWEEAVKHQGSATPPTPKQDEPQKKRNIYQKLGIKQLFGMRIIETKYQPPQKEGCQNDTYTYEETLETVKKLSKLMQKEGWEEDWDRLFRRLNIDENMWPMKHFIRSLLAKERQKVEEMKGAIKEIEELMSESDGVYGLHRNGDPADWEWLQDNGWLEKTKQVLSKIRTKEGDIKS